MEEGIVIGGGCTLLKLAQKVDAIKAGFSNEEQRIGAEIVRRALHWPAYPAAGLVTTASARWGPLQLAQELSCPSSHRGLHASVHGQHHLGALWCWQAQAACSLYVRAASLGALQRISQATACRTSTMQLGALSSEGPAEVRTLVHRRALGSPLRLIANNSGTNGAVVMQKARAGPAPLSSRCALRARCCGCCCCCCGRSGCTRTRAQPPSTCQRCCPAHRLAQVGRSQAASMLCPVRALPAGSEHGLGMQVLESGDVNIGFNAATGKYEDLMKAGIIDPTKASLPSGRALCSQHVTVHAVLRSARLPARGRLCWCAPSALHAVKQLAPEWPAAACSALLVHSAPKQPVDKCHTAHDPAHLAPLPQALTKAPPRTGGEVCA